MKEYISKNTLVGEIVSTYPESIEVLMEQGMHCLGCPASQAENVEAVCMVHGLDPDEVIGAVNEKISETRAGS